MFGERRSRPLGRGFRLTTQGLDTYPGDACLVSLGAAGGGFGVDPLSRPSDRKLERGLPQTSVFGNVQGINVLEDIRVMAPITPLGLLHAGTVMGFVLEGAMSGLMYRAH